MAAVKLYVNFSVYQNMFIHGKNIGKYPICKYVPCYTGLEHRVAILSQVLLRATDDRQLSVIFIL